MELMEELVLDKKRVRSLAAGIVLQAIRDWKRIVSAEISQHHTLIKQKEIPHYGAETYDTIRKFFNSDYGEMLCESIGRNAGNCLSWCEQYRLNALKADSEGNFKKWRRNYD